MFTFTTVDGAGQQFPVSLLCVDDVQFATTFADITVQAALATDTLTVHGVAYVATLTAGGAAYPFPLSGTDFLTAVTGKFTITITTRLATGLYRYPFSGVKTLIGRCGGLPCGIGQGGRFTEIAQATTAYLQVQALPADWRQVIRQNTLAYAVKTVTKL